MTHHNIPAAVIAVVIHELDADPKSVTADKHLIDDLNADSLDIVSLGLALGEHFEVSIEAEEVAQAATVQGLIALVSGKLCVAA